MKLAPLLLCLALAACASQKDLDRGPRATLRAYSEALVEGRADDAYQLLSNEAKRSISLEAFKRLVDENHADVVDIAQALRRPSSDPLVTAVVVAPNGDKLVLVYESGRWRVDGTGIDRYGQATPRQALEGFLRAFERKRYDIIMRYVPNAEREGLGPNLWGPDAPPAKPAPAPALDPDAGAGAADAAAPAPPNPWGGLTVEMLRGAWEGDEKEYIAAKVQAIKTALPNAKIEEMEDRAAMAYGAGGTVLLVRENGLWKIKDFE